MTAPVIILAFISPSMNVFSFFYCARFDFIKNVKFFIISVLDIRSNMNTSLSLLTIGY